MLADIVANDAIVVIDWQQNGTSNITRSGVRVHSLFKISELVNILRTENRIDDGCVKKVTDHNNQLAELEGVRSPSPSMLSNWWPKEKKSKIDDEVETFFESQLPENDEFVPNPNDINAAAAKCGDCSFYYNAIGYDTKKKTKKKIGICTKHRRNSRNIPETPLNFWNPKMMDTENDS